MPASFDVAVKTVLVNEGGYVNNPADPGGETKYGISKRAHPDVDIKNLTPQGAAEILRHEYWQYQDCNSQNVATKMLDMSVNLGPGTATILCQKALNDIGQAVKVDGRWGPKTQATLNGSLESEILPEIRVHQSSYYVELVAKRPDLYPFLTTWLRRVQSC